MERASRTMTWLLAAVAAVSLLVGGIGIMNITLLSVTERTREIGLRMAVGARGKDVMRQFLFEALVISAAGGLLGIIIGVIASIGIARSLQWATVVSPLSVLLAFGVAAAVGVFFGWYPARRAAQLDPIVALRRDDHRQYMLRFLLVSAQIAVRALRRNALRTGLTMLGVVIGVAAVIAMVALGSGARGSVETSLKSAGTNIIQVSAGNYTRGGESMNIASGLGAATTLTDRRCRRDSRHSRRPARGRGRAQSIVRDRAAPPVLHAGQRRASVARRHSWLGMARWPLRGCRRHGGDGPRRGARTVR